MATDKRVKGCSNPECVNHIKRIKMKAENEYCPKCGAELVFVCKKCFKEIQDIDEDHSICTHCIEEAQEKKEKRIENRCISGWWQNCYKSNERRRKRTR